MPMGRGEGNNAAPKSGNESNDGSHQNQPRSNLHPTHQQGAAFPPYHQENHDYHHQPEAFPPHPEMAHAFPASFPATQTPQFNEHPMPVFHNQPGFNMQGGMQGNPMHGGTPYTNPAFQPPQFNEHPMPVFHNQPGFNMHGGMQGNPMHGGTPYTNPAFQPMPIMPMPSPAVGQPSTGYTEPWKSGLLDCCDDPWNAILTFFCPCVIFGQIAEIVDQGQSSCGSCALFYILIAYCIATPCLLSCSYRSKLRARFGLVESPGPDCIIHCFCEWCALCQEYRELKQRGYDPVIGWAANAAKMRMASAGVAMTPPVPNMMGR